MVLGARLLQLLAAALGIELARRRRAHRPVAVFLAAMAAADWIRAWVVDRFDLTTPGPYTGIRRAAWSLQEVLFVAWPAGVVVLLLAICLRWRRPRLLLAALPWIVLEMVVVASYPAIRGNLLVQWVHGGATLAAVLAGVAAVVARIFREVRPDATYGAALLILSFTGATLLGPYIGGPVAWWALAQVVYAALYLLLVIVQGGALWRSRSSSSSLESASRSSGPALH